MKVVAAVVAVVVLAVPHAATATPGTVIAPAPAAAVLRQHSTESGQISATLRVLARLHEFGYSINTPARADRAIRHWQRVNGLTVDGIVGPQVLASLGMSAIASDDATTATRPAVRDNLPRDASVEDVIRFVWPDALEDRAVQIAYRESRLVPSARNACCFGLFQINWSAHRGWLAEIGVENTAQLLDAGTNARAALALFERDGWQPWQL